MEESQTLQDPRTEAVEIVENAAVPVWLVIVYLTLFAWSIWNLFKYWD